MTQTAPSTTRISAEHKRARSIDIGGALDLLTSVVNDHGEDVNGESDANHGRLHDAFRYTIGGIPHCIVGHALARVSVDVADLEAMRDQRLRDLYRDGRLPITLTLGALIVLDAAQQSEDRGRTWGTALDDATVAAVRFLDLVAVIPEVTHFIRHRAERCHRLGRSPTS